MDTAKRPVSGTRVSPHLARMHVRAVPCDLHIDLVQLTRGTDRPVAEHVIIGCILEDTVDWRPDAERPYRAFGYPLVPALYIVGASVILVVLFVFQTATTWPGLIIILTGVPVYFIWRRVGVPMSEEHVADASGADA